MLGKVIHATKEIHAFRQRHLHALREAKAAGRNRVCRELAEELRKLRRLDKPEYVETKFILENTSGSAEYRDSEELAEAINRLPAEQYRKLRFML